MGAVFGLGFPPFRGGPFRAIDAAGAEHIVKRLRYWQQKHGSRFEAAPRLIQMAERGETFYPPD